MKREQGKLRIMLCNRAHEAAFQNSSGGFGVIKLLCSDNQLLNDTKWPDLSLLERKNDRNNQYVRRIISNIPSSKTSKLVAFNRAARYVFQAVFGIETNRISSANCGSEFPPAFEV